MDRHQRDVGVGEVGVVGCPVSQGDHRARDASSVVSAVADVSYASEATASDALAVDRPLLATHTHLLVGGRSSPRFISLGLAREIAAAGE